MTTEETTNQMTNLIAVGAGLYVLDKTMSMGTKKRKPAKMPGMKFSMPKRSFTR